MTRRMVRAFALALALAGGPIAKLAAQGPPLWTVEPSRRIGVALGDPDYEFDMVMGAVRLSDSTIVVGEMSSQEVRFFGADGRLVRKQGRDGEGPGEYRQIRFLLECGEDRVRIYDTQLTRLTVLGPAAAVESIHQGPSPDGRSGPYDLACDREGRFIASSWTQGQIEALRSGRSGPFRGTQVVVLADRTGTVRDTIGVFPGGERYLFRRPDGSPGGTGPRELGPETHIAIGHGRAFVGDAATPHVYVYEGRGLDTLAVPFESRPITREDLDRLLQLRLSAAEGPDAARRIRQWHADYEFPTRYPFYSALTVDERGLLWVRGYPRPGEEDVEWLVVHPSGGTIARVRLPTDLTVTRIGRDFLLGVLDVDGVEVIQEYRLRAGPRAQGGA